MKLIFKICVLLLVTFYSYAKTVNVYLLFESPELHQSIKEFNSYLERNEILARYQIEPFLSKYPLHITLFLAEYPDEHIKDLKKQIIKIAKHWHPISLNTSQMITTSGYVMLDVDNTNQVEGKNPELQRLSDEVTMALTNLRDFNAKIPDWATSIPEKRKAFLRYGSPNVFFEYSPHFTLMAKNFIDSTQAAQFHDEMMQLIQAYNFPKILTQSAVIALGYVDSFGQVTEEIAKVRLDTQDSR